MSALPHRHDGGDRLHRTAGHLPIDSGYLMTSDRRPRHVKLRNPPDRRRDIVAVTHSTASQDTLKPPPRTQRQPAVTPLGPNRHCARSKTAVQMSPACTGRAAGGVKRP
jgi:hypothetical protein